MSEVTPPNFLFRISPCWDWRISWTSSPTSLAFLCLTPPILSTWSSSGAWTFPGGRAVISRTLAQRSVSQTLQCSCFFFFVLWNFVLFHPAWINGPVNVIQPVFFLYLIAIDLYIWALPQTALSAPQNLFSSSSLMFPLSPSLLTNQSPYGLVFPWVVAFPPLTSVSPRSLSLPGPTQLSSALMFDAVHVVVGAVRELNRSQEIGVKPLSCTSPQIWQHGTSLMNYLRMVKPPPPVCLHISRHTLRNFQAVGFIPKY